MRQGSRASRRRTADAGPDPRVTTNPLPRPRARAFDAAAAGYDEAFTFTHLGRWYRTAARKWLEAAFRPGSHILELGCGTGEDALWLAGRGIRVTALDASPAMLEVARAKAAQAGAEAEAAIRFVGADLADGRWPERVRAAWAAGCVEPAPPGGAGVAAGAPAAHALGPNSTSSPAHGSGGAAAARAETARAPEALRGPALREAPASLTPQFDGALAAFGVLNCLDAPGRVAVARGLAPLVRPGGRLVLVVMGPLCPWEIAWHLLRGRPKAAVRRWRSGAWARVSGAAVQVWYPSPRRLAREFGDGFRAVATAGIGALLPPPYLEPLVQRRPQAFQRLARLERRWSTTFPWTWLNDHYLLVLERR